MIPQRFTRYVFAFFMAFLMSCLMSLCITIANIGIVDDLFVIWMQAWILAFVIAFPAVIMVSPLVHFLTAKVVKV